MCGSKLNASAADRIRRTGPEPAAVPPREPGRPDDGRAAPRPAPPAR